MYLEKKKILIDKNLKKKKKYLISSRAVVSNVGKICRYVSINIFPFPNFPQNCCYILGKFFEPIKANEQCSQKMRDKISM